LLSEKQEISLEEWLPPVHSTNLTHTETCSCVDTSVFTNQWWHATIYLPFCEFDCILPLVVCSHILHVVVLIAAMLHIIFCDLIEAVSECQILIRYLKTERNDAKYHMTGNAALEVASVDA
jgi:hypothetical protein